jgi:hypothetical protein
LEYIFRKEIYLKKADFKKFGFSERGAVMIHGLSLVLSAIFHSNASIYFGDEKILIYLFKRKLLF